MYFRILLNSRLPLKDWIKNFVSYLQIIRAANIAWSRRYRKVFSVHEEFSKQFDLKGLFNLSKMVASRIFYARILGLDACYDSSGDWRMVEANVVGQHTIKFIQNAGFPFFGEFTDEVVEYCKTNHWALQNS